MYVVLVEQIIICHVRIRKLISVITTKLAHEVVGAFFEFKSQIHVPKCLYRLFDYKIDLNTKR